MPPDEAGQAACERRLRDVPWAALAGLGDALREPLARVLEGDAAERVLDRLLRAHRGLLAEQRRAVAEAMFGVGLWRRRLRAQCGRDATPLQLLACLARDLGGLGDAARMLAVELPPPRPPPADWRDRFSVPDWLAQELVSAVGDEAPALAAALNLPGPVCLRANRLRTTREALADRLRAEGVETRPGRFSPDCLVVKSPRPNVLGLPAAREGLFEVQDEGSQLLGELVSARPGDVVLDACAGAGGKALQLAAAVGAQGAVWAVDVDAARLERLRVRAQRAGVAVHLAGAAAPDGMRFDRVLVDAPCSELGALRRGPDVRWRLEPARFVALEQVQREILRAAARAVKPGGWLVYATCTWRCRENDDVVDEFLEAQPEWRQLPAAAPRGEGPVPIDVVRGGRLETFPHRHGLDGFFGAVLGRT
ncbi:MAG: RsmB/NOP family class I SAM-dependent RNA methyltransferase [Deltaproteobacteria bacterium]|nr:RsmB/NOP family class I SAM-dependent RNA methyltransferase [Deltaproteobacteria bacterium]